MLVEKEVIRPGTFWYRDEQSGLPRKLVVTPELTSYWHDQGNKMLGLGLTVPVPCEHDFSIHPMTPADGLRNNAGWVKEYRLKDSKLFGIVDVQDESLAKKLPHTIRWTSPWINTFTDGSGREWKNVISHLALTTRPRIVEQAPFPSVAAALSIANVASVEDVGTKGFCLSRAGLLFQETVSKRWRARYPLAFSMWGGGIKLAFDDMPPKKGSKSKKDTKSLRKTDDNPTPGEGSDVGQSGNGQAGGDSGGDVFNDGEDDTDDLFGDAGDTTTTDPAANPLANPLADANGDVGMEELLCDLLSALGVQMPENVGEAEFKRCLYEAAMAKIKEYATKGQGVKDEGLKPNPLNKPPAPGQPQPNPLIQQEQQPMYMSLDDINKIQDDTMRNIALSMYNENVKLRGELDTTNKTTASLRDAKLQEANAKRQTRVHLLGRLSPRVKADLDAMLALPSMALSLGDGGAVVDPMAPTLSVLEKGLADIPTLLTTDQSALSLHAQPTDADVLNQEDADKLADSMARMMGCPPEQKRAS